MLTEQLSLFAPLPAPRGGEYLVPDDLNIEACRSCGAQIVWARTAKGRAIPLSIATIEHRDDKRYALSHFVDCPEGREWKRR